MTDHLLGDDVRPTTSYVLRVNGYERPVSDAWIGESLLYVLRERLGLAGAKDGCQQGECGACSVQVDGQLVNGCLVPAALAADSEIFTVEGLAETGGASDVQQALADSGAVQCGYCTPGLAVAVHDLLQRNHRPTDVEARQALCGNLCRCTGYRGVLAAVQTVAEAREAKLEADLAAAEAAAQAVEEGAEPAGPVEPSPADLPVYTDAEVWHEAEQPDPVEHLAAVPEQAARPHGTHLATPPHGTGYDPSYETGSFPMPGFDAAGYPASAYRPAGYENAGGQPHGGGYGGSAFDGYDGTGYDGTTSAHGIRLPEDDHA